MKAVIMAGGYGKRIRDMDASVPKPMINICGKAVLQWIIECLSGQSIKDILITVGYKSEKIIGDIGDGKRHQCNISYYVEKEPIGNAGALFQLYDKRVLDEDFVLLNADIIFDIDFKRLIEFHKNKAALVTIFTHPNDHPCDSGIVETDQEGLVTNWLTKENDRKKYYNNNVNAGIHIVDPEVFGILRDQFPLIDGSHKVDLDRDILIPMIPSRKIYAYRSPEYIKDMGTPDRFWQVSDDLSNGKISRKNLKNKQKAIFLDRDGTINKSVGFLTDIDELILNSEAGEAIRSINRSDFLCIVVTNQPVIARGELTEEGLRDIHNKLEVLLGTEGAYLDAIYYCPHHPDKGYEGEIVALKIDCDCRKPKPGMLLQAARDYNIDLVQSYMIGDDSRDMEAGRRAGCKTIYISEKSDGSTPVCDYVSNNLLGAVDIILEREIC